MDYSFECVGGALSQHAHRAIPSITDERGGPIRCDRHALWPVADMDGHTNHGDLIWRAYIQHAHHVSMLITDQRRRPIQGDGYGGWLAADADGIAQHHHVVGLPLVTEILVLWSFFFFRQ